MIERKIFRGHFVSNDPDANPYEGLAYHMGTDVTPQREFEEWQQDNRGTQIKGISETQGGSIIIFYDK